MSPLARRPAERGGFSTLRRSRKPSKRSLDPVLPEVYQAVMQRDGDCVIRDIPHPGFMVPCRGRTVWHHRLPVERGGPSTVSNGLRLCTGHHDLVHSYRTAARLMGWLVREGQDPSQVRVMIRGGYLVLLREDGTYLEAGDG